MNSVTLYYNYDDNGYVEEYMFSVKEDWLNCYLGNDNENCVSCVSYEEPMSIDDFLCYYTSDDSVVVYEDALFDNAVVIDMTLV